jgi:hypothetical protein
MARFRNHVSIDQYKWVLKSLDVAVQGFAAFGDPATGFVTITPSLTTIALGHFAEGLTGDGIKKINVALFAEVQAYWFTNDTGTVISKAFTVANYLNGSTVTGAAGCPAGYVVEANTAQVLVVPRVIAAPVALDEEPLP